MRHRIYLVALLAVLALGVSEAQAVSLNQAAPTDVGARQAIRAYLSRMEAEGENTGARINRCVRYSPSLLRCSVTEFNVEIGGELSYRIAARLRDGELRLYSSMFGPL